MFDLLFSIAPHFVVLRRKHRKDFDIDTLKGLPNLRGYRLAGCHGDAFTPSLCLGRDNPHVPGEVTAKRHELRLEQKNSHSRLPPIPTLMKFVTSELAVP